MSDLNFYASMCWAGFIFLPGTVARGILGGVAILLVIARIWVAESARRRERGRHATATDLGWIDDITPSRGIGKHV